MSKLTFVHDMNLLLQGNDEIINVTIPSHLSDFIFIRNPSVALLFKLDWAIFTFSGAF